MKCSKCGKECFSKTYETSGICYTVSSCCGANIIYEQISTKISGTFENFNFPN
jgi:hypothetical protein